MTRPPLLSLAMLGASLVLYAFAIRAERHAFEVTQGDTERFKNLLALNKELETANAELQHETTTYSGQVNELLKTNAELRDSLNVSSGLLEEGTRTMRNAQRVMTEQDVALKSCGLPDPRSFPTPAPVREILNFHFDPVANEFVRDADTPRAASPLPR